MVEKGFVKDILSKIVFAPPASYLLMKYWGLHVDKMGFWKRLRYMADVESFTSHLPNGLEDLVNRIAADPSDYALGTAAAVLAVAGVELLVKYTTKAGLKWQEWDK